MVKGSSLQRLTGVFLQEARDRTRSMEHDLLRIEKGDDAGKADAECVRNILRSAHSLKGAARLVGQVGIESVCHWIEELLTRSGARALSLEARHIQLLLKATDAIAAALPAIEQGQQPPPDPLEEVSAELVTAAEEIPGASADDETFTIAPLAEPARRTPGRSANPPRHLETISVSDEVVLDSFVRVPSGRLDEMLRHSGQLLLARTAAANRVTQLSKVREILRRNRKQAHSGVERELELKVHHLLTGMAADNRTLKRISVGLDAEIRNARLQPFNWVCEGLERLVRDLAVAAGKQVKFQIEGGQIEIDRSILEELQTAIRHIVRNAVDHGIETTGERVGAGKSAEGQILISASLQQDRIAIRISDDGRGLARERIKNSAIEYGLDEKLINEDVERLIFLPGVSTSTVTTRVSGRGVGLDAVRSCVENMRGVLKVEHAEGAGTTFIMTVPMTVGSMRALLVRSGGQLFALDSSAIRRVFRFSSEMISAVGDDKLVVRSENPLPLVRLADWLKIEREDVAAADGQLVGIELTDVGGGAAVEVDEIVSEQEFLIHSLGPRLSKLADFSGVIVMPDGGITLVLNAAAVGLAALSGGPSRSSRGTSTSREKRYRILIVDDSLTTRTLEKTILEGAGYEVSLAADGIEAWQLLEAEGGDLLLADVDMPGMDGLMLTDKVRQSTQFRDLPVILLTARESAADRQRGLDLGADAYLIKSAFDQRDLLNTIGQLL